MQEKIVMASKIKVERNHQPATVAELIPQRFKGRKRWQIAQDRSKDGAQQKLNIVTEEHYHMVLRSAKQLLAGSKETVFERDYKGDTSESHLVMHGFMSAGFYLLLECELQYDYVINYAFHNCKHEQTLVKLLEPIIALGRAKPIEVKPDYPTFYRNVLAFQQQHFLYTL